MIAPAAVARAAVGDSVAIDGCCLTVTEVDLTDLCFDAVPETLARTILGRLQPGSAVNVQPALRVGTGSAGTSCRGTSDRTPFVGPLAMRVGLSQVLQSAA